MKTFASVDEGYRPVHFWLWLLSAVVAGLSTYWLAMILWIGRGRDWFSIFSGCASLLAAAYAIGLFRRALAERKKKSGLREAHLK